MSFWHRFWPQHDLKKQTTTWTWPKLQFFVKTHSQTLSPPHPALQCSQHISTHRSSFIWLQTKNVHQRILKLILLLHSGDCFYFWILSQVLFLYRVFSYSIGYVFKVCLWCQSVAPSVLSVGLSWESSLKFLSILSHSILCYVWSVHRHPCAYRSSCTAIRGFGNRMCCIYTRRSWLNQYSLGLLSLVIILFSLTLGLGKEMINPLVSP